MSGTYGSYSALALWQMVADENPANNTAHEGAWEQKQQLLGDQIQNLQELRHQVAAAWNPDTSAAAQRFLNQIDAIVEVMEQVKDAAGKVQKQFVNVTGALLAAKKQLEPLQASYYDQKAALKSYLENSTPLGSMISGLPDDWVPTMGLPDAIGPAVLGLHQDHLDARARSIMESADNKVASATTEQVYIPGQGRLEDGDILPTPDTAGPTSGNGGQHQRSYLPTPVFDPPTADGRPVRGGLAPSIVPVNDPLDRGPFLTGGPALPVSPPVLAPPLPTPVRGPLPTGTPVPIGPGWMAETPSGQRALRPGGLIDRPVGTPTPVRALPEEPLGRGSATDGPFSTATGRPGVIGHQPGRAAATRQPNRPASGQYGSTEAEERTPEGGWRDHSYERYLHRRTERDEAREVNEQWQVDEGVTPLLMPPAAPSWDDVTPGVIGIER